MQKKHHKKFYFIIAVIICLITAGITFILKTYHNYVEQFIEIQDAKQLQLAHSVDRNIESWLRQKQTDLDFIVSLDTFRLAEQRWLHHQETKDILFQLTEHHLKEDPLVHDFAAIKDNRILLNTKGQADYQFLNDDTDSPQRICLDAEKNVYLAMISSGTQGIDYACFINLQNLYQKISSTELANADQLILLDKNLSIILHYCTDEKTVKSTLVETCPKRDDFLHLLSAEKNQEQNCFPFVYQTKKMSKGYNAHIMIIPTSKSSNQSFAIGLVSNIDTALQPLEHASMLWLFGCAVILLGISFLLILLLHYRHRDEQIVRELELLRQKNISMEELNRKTQEMAHHQRLEMIGTLTSGIAHEFNNLLTPIMGYSMMTLEQLPPEQEDLYDNVLEIYNASRKARKITAQLSQYSRKNGGEEKQLFSLDLLLTNVLHVALPSCPPTVTVRTLPGSGHAKIYGNETQLSQLFLNLVINAFHSMAVGGGTLTISTQAEHEELIVQITDTGCGIPESILPHIFEPFFTTKEGGKGSGLGLAIAQQIAEEHHGRIHVTSKEGEGTIFTLSFPAYYESVS